MVNVMNQSGEVNQGANVPLAAMFTDGSYLNEDLYKSKDQKISQFISMCEVSTTSSLSEYQIAERIVRNALTVEFGPKQASQTEMVKTIVDALYMDSTLKEEMLNFAKRHFDQRKISEPLIN